MRCGFGWRSHTGERPRTAEGGASEAGTVEPVVSQPHGTVTCAPRLHVLIDETMRQGQQTASRPPSAAAASAAQRCPPVVNFRCLPCCSYVLLWIALSAAVILYNKWVLAFSGAGCWPVANSLALEWAGFDHATGNHRCLPALVS